MNNDKLNKVLMWIIAGLLVVILAGTIVGFVLRGRKTPEVLISQGKAENLTPPEDTDETAYFQLGTIRIMPAVEESSEEKETEDKDKKNKDESQLASVMVISPWLAYTAGDTEFFEELSRKQGLIKSVFTTYFSSKTKKEILSATEEQNTAALMAQINGRLSLNKISNIYFTDYIFLE